MIQTASPRARWKGWLTNLAIATAAAAFAAVSCELASRLVLDPVDYLTPILVRDDVLGIRLPPRSGGHDDWGFRNRRVPDSAEIVALGDSHTYGNAAKMDESWPAVLERLTGKSVYNLGMGGYGPNQYYHLLRTKALALKPRTVICALFLGDDFDNAFSLTYGREAWAYLRRESPSERRGAVDADIWERRPPSPSLAWHQRVRAWLSRHSILYRLLFHGLFQSMKGRYQVENAARLYPSTTSLLLPRQDVSEAFMPATHLRALDQESPNVREGMRITFQLLRDMNALCAEGNVGFLVAVIPTKEMVFARYLEHDPTLAMSETLDAVIANERVARRALFAELDQSGIRHVDLLPALMTASKSERIYTYSAIDMHPNANGYRVIAEAIASELRRVGDGPPRETR